MLAWPGRQLITPRRDDGVQPVVAEHMRGKIGRAEDFRERNVADAQASRVGAERRHHGALAVTGKAAALGDAGAGGDAGFRVQMAGDLAVGATRLVAKGDRADADFAGDDAAEVGRQRRIVIARDPDPAPPRLHRRYSVAIRIGEARMRIAVMKLSPSAITIRGLWRAITAARRDSVAAVS